MRQMPWRTEVRHTTGYAYPRPVVASYNEARVTPLTTGGQLTIASRFEVDPAVRVYRYWDYWGALVHAFDIHSPHTELSVSVTSVVETPGDHGPDGIDQISWTDLEDTATREAHFEYLMPTPATAADARLERVGAQLQVEALTPRDGLSLAVAWVRSQLEYQKGTTDVSTPAVDAWAAGRGVCQDFVHLTIALLRTMGIPAKYVSGYFHPVASIAVGETVVGESHAWAEAWIGDWHPFDPTNLVPVGQRHIVVARGRDYRDVAPLKGLYSGARSSIPAVTVELTRQA